MPSVWPRISIRCEHMVIWVVTLRWRVAHLTVETGQGYVFGQMSKDCRETTGGRNSHVYVLVSGSDALGGCGKHVPMARFFKWTPLVPQTTSGSPMPPPAASTHCGDRGGRIIAPMSLRGGLLTEIATIWRLLPACCGQTLDSLRRSQDLPHVNPPIQC